MSAKSLAAAVDTVVLPSSSAELEAESGAGESTIVIEPLTLFVARCGFFAPISEGSSSAGRLVPCRDSTNSMASLEESSRITIVSSTVAVFRAFSMWFSTSSRPATLSSLLLILLTATCFSKHYKIYF